MFIIIVEARIVVFYSSSKSSMVAMWLLGVARLLLGGCVVVAMVLLGVTMVLLGGCYGVAKCCYGIARWLLWCC